MSYLFRIKRNKCLIPPSYITIVDVYAEFIGVIVDDPIRAARAILNHVLDKISHDGKYWWLYDDKHVELKTFILALEETGVFNIERRTISDTECISQIV